MTNESFALEGVGGGGKMYAKSPGRIRRGAAFYMRLAVSNMKKNANIYFPFLLAGALLSGLYYMLLAVGEMAVNSGMKGAAEMAIILEMCSGLCIFVMFLILFYINSFVMKRRKRELGLYCILGMEKRHLNLLLFWEVLLSALLSIAGGIVSGILFSQLLFLVFLKLLQIPAVLSFMIPLASVGNTLAVFGTGYLATLLYDWWVIHRTNPVELLRSRQEGEREPKTKWITFLAGTAALVCGYGLALRVRTISEGLFIFFPAALLVIIATYCLFQAGSIVLLKFLKKRKKFYYRPQNFIAVSGMLYRMKQNAAGLATIAVLSTALLVVLSSSVTLYSGEEAVLAKMFPREYKIEVRPNSQNISGISANKRAADTAYEKEIRKSLQELAQKTGVSIVNDYGVSGVWWMAEKEGNQFDENALTSVRDVTMDVEKINSFTMITLEDYNGMTGQRQTLEADEVIYISSDPEPFSTVSIKGREFAVKEQKAELKELPSDAVNQDMFGNYAVVVPDRLTLMQLRGEEASAESFGWQYLFDLEGDGQAQQEFIGQALICLSLDGQIRLENKSEQREGFYLLYGSILFIGLLFVCLFLLATALIIYYKQVTEGYDDRERFVIMEKVGMRDVEIRRAIGKQVLIVFFLPLVTAVLHICVAAKTLQMFLIVLGLSDGQLFWKCIGICCLIFGAVYYAIYHLTSKVYYRIVHGQSRIPV